MTEKSNTEYLAERNKKRQAEKATMYSLEHIRVKIDEALSYSLPQGAQGAAAVAQAMIAYNRMIEDRWS